MTTDDGYLGARCGCAHAEDPSACAGPAAAVRVVDRTGAEATGCVHHAAIALASITDARVYPGPDGPEGAAIDAYTRALHLAPFSGFLPGEGGGSR